MEQNKKNTGLAVLITILVLIILGLTGLIVYDKVLKKDKVEPNTTENNNVVSEEQSPKYNEIKLEYFDSEVIADFVLSHIGNKNENSLADKWERIGLLNDYASYSNLTAMTEDEDIQRSPYISGEKYKNLYAAIYGDNYNFESDTAEEGKIYFNCGDSYKSLKGKSYICWNNLRGDSPFKIVNNNIHNVNISNNQIKVEGEITYRIYDFEDPDSYHSEEAGFEINYKIKDNKAYLYSIIVK